MRLSRWQCAMSLARSTAQCSVRMCEVSSWKNIQPDRFVFIGCNLNDHRVFPIDFFLIVRFVRTLPAHPVSVSGRDALMFTHHRPILAACLQICASERIRYVITGHSRFWLVEVTTFAPSEQCLRFRSREEALSPPHSQLLPSTTADPLTPSLIP